MLILSQSALAKLGERITPAQWDALKTYSLQDQQYDAIRQEILSQLSTRVDQLPNVSSSDGDYTEQCETLAGIQELLYDLQLVEHVSRGPLIGMAKLVMGMDKRRCVKRVQTVSVKAKKLGSGSRPQQQQASPSSKHQQRRRLGPAASLSLTFNSSANSPTKLHGDAANRSRHSHLTASTTRNSEERHSAPKMRSPVSSANVSSATETRRGSKQRRSTRAAVWDKEKPSYNRSPLTLTSAAQKALAKGVVGVEDSEGDDEDAVAPAPSSNKSSSTICAKGSAARLIRKKRGQPAPTPRQSGTSRQGAGSGNSGSSSPRKLTTAGSGGRKRASVIKRQAEGSSSSGDDDGDEDETGEDEPTYCLCKRISFGEMICCDHGKCPVEWFHFSCVNIKIKPKGKKWFCPMCRGDKPNVLKTNLK